MYISILKPDLARFDYHNGGRDIRSVTTPDNVISTDDWWIDKIETMLPSYLVIHLSEDVKGIELNEFATFVPVRK